VVPLLKASAHGHYGDAGTSFHLLHLLTPCKGLQVMRKQPLPLTSHLLLLIWLQCCHTNKLITAIQAAWPWACSHHQCEFPQLQVVTDAVILQGLEDSSSSSST
jgi:hypothetical protein